MSITQQAYQYADKCHKGQTRKYVGTPYIFHPVAVADMVSTHLPEYGEIGIAVALLHDVLEDTDATYGDLQKRFGTEIANGVLGLSDVSKPEHGNREVRKSMDREHVINSGNMCILIKLCDLIHNVESIRIHDKKFYEIYVKEANDFINDVPERLRTHPVYHKAVLEILLKL